MSALLGSLFAAWWPQIVGGLAMLAAAIGLYRKGKDVERQKAKLEDVTNANAIRKAGADARAGADPDRMRSDGFRRD